MSVEYDSFAIQIFSFAVIAGGGVYAWRKWRNGSYDVRRYFGYGAVSTIDTKEVGTNTSPPRLSVSQHIQCNATDDHFECVGSTTTDEEAALNTKSNVKRWSFALW